MINVAPFVPPGIGNNDQLLGVEHIGTLLEYKTLVAGTGISISFAQGQITISSTGGGGGGGITNPMTTLGDIIYENATPAAARLAGNTSSTKQFLYSQGTGSAAQAPQWGTITFADMPTTAIRKVTTSFNFALTDYTVEVDTTSGAITGTLPQGSTVTNGQIFILAIIAGSNSATIAAYSGDNIAGQSSWQFTNIGSSLGVQWDGSAWALVY